MVYIVKYFLEILHPIAKLIAHCRIVVDLFFSPGEEMKYNGALSVSQWAYLVVGRYLR